MKSGAPQGSVLSALLFIIHVNDIHNLIASNATLFTDDTKVLSSLFLQFTITNFYLFTNMHSHIQLKNDIYFLVDWTIKWGMKFNIDKCTVLQLGYKNKQHVYTMYDPMQQIRTNIKSNNSETDIGVTIK